MKKKVLIGAIAASAIAIAGVVTYFVRRQRNMADADTSGEEDMMHQRKPRKHITDIFQKAKAHVNGHEPALQM
jgi:hypothetical protein